MTPAEIVNRWLSAWRDGDLEACARLLPDTSVVHASQPRALAGDYRGFEAAAAYVRRKAELVGPSFSWEPGEVIEVGPFAVLPFRMSAGDRESWWQVAVYRIEDGLIAEVWLHEEPEATGQ
ncbi:MAG: nuclear transport factor 2 family protein [Chloroflexi bacterium]|nr:nuclear transport factor 2 family protein [Chloroflexota bacterium]